MECSQLTKFGRNAWWKGRERESEEKLEEWRGVIAGYTYLCGLYKGCEGVALSPPPPWGEMIQ